MLMWYFSNYSAEYLNFKYYIIHDRTGLCRCLWVSNFSVRDGIILLKITPDAHLKFKRMSNLEFHIILPQKWEKGNIVECEVIAFRTLLAAPHQISIIML